MIVMYRILLTKQAHKQLSLIKSRNLVNKLRKLIFIIQENPYQNPPPYEKLIGFKCVYSRRINVKHRLVYEILETEKTVKILSVWSHYEQ